MRPKTGMWNLSASLLNTGQTPNWCCCSCVTALHTAIIKEHVDVVRLLLANGADTDIDYDGKISTLQLARRVGNKAIVETIEQHDRSSIRQTNGDSRNGTNKKH